MSKKYLKSKKKKGLIILVKTKKYISKLNDLLFRRRISDIKGLISRLKSDGINPQQEFFTWLLDVLHYGFVGAFIISVLFGFSSIGRFIMLMLCIGMIRWFWIEFVKDTLDAFMNGKREY